MTNARALRSVALLVVLLLAALSVYARVGGGESYSGGGSGGSDGDGGGGEIAYLIIRFLFWLTIKHPVIGIPVDIVVITAVVIWLKGRTGKESLVRLSAPVASSSSQTLDALRKFDPNFSESVFADFCYSLYGRAHQLRGERRLERYTPYLSAPDRCARRLYRVHAV